MSQQVTFESNVPVQLAVKFAEPRKFAGKWGERYMYSLVDGRVAYVQPEVIAQVKANAIQPGELFWIQKKWSGKKGEPAWDAWLDPATEKARAKAEDPS